MFDDETKNQETQLNNETTTEQSPQQDGLKEQYARLNADFQNFKRRVEKERLEWMNSAQASILKKLLPVFDELDNVILMAKKQQAIASEDSWVTGLELSQKNWQKILQDLGVQEIETTGSFNPEVHEGLMQEEAEGFTAGAIVKTFSKGYSFKGTVIRHAKVSVAK